MSHDSTPPQAVARAAVQRLELSKVREVANAGFGREDVLRFWFGEGDTPTPGFIRDAAIEALAAGRTFYAHNQGLAELREALARYLGDLHGRTFDIERLSVTSSGVSALMIAMQAVVDPGDRVVAVTPVWPNMVEIPKILGAEVHRVGLKAQQGRWRLDLDELVAAITSATRLVVINSPGNPTGWVLEADQRAPLLEHCRRLGVWLLTDDVYERLYYGAAASAPSLLAIADEDDRLIGANSFSKAWLMTGWRLGWLVSPPALHPEIGKLIEYNTSCAPDFVQAAGVAALAEGEPHVAQLRADLTRKRDRLIAALGSHPKLEVTVPEGGLYAFFRVAGEADSMATAKRLIAEAGLGLAPGAAFGPEGEGWLRWCFAAKDEALDEGMRRLETWLG